MNYWDIVNIFFVLGILTLVMYGILFLMKKYLYSFNGKSVNTSSISVISTKAIAPKKFITAVRIADKIYLLGLSDNSINLIDKINPDQFIDEEVKQEETKKSFLEILKNNLGKK